MKVSLTLYAGLKDKVGARNLCLDVRDGSTVADLRERLAGDYPDAAPLLSRVVFAIDDEYVAFEEKLHDGAEVAAIPPVSGGAPSAGSTPDALFRLTTERMEGEALAQAVRQDNDGAVALFYGVVRNHNDGREVLRLEYEAHESMALRKMREAGEETKRRFPDVSAVGVWHRTGMLQIGETSLLVAVSSPHRAEAFAACHWAVDRVKETVPVWKREHYADGSVWLEGHPVEPPQLASQ